MSGARPGFGTFETLQRTLAHATRRRHCRWVPRPLRDISAGFFHVFTHSVWAADRLYRDDTDRLVFLRELARTIRKARWTCLAFCLMQTHYHLVLEVEDGALPIGMHALNFRYACAYNTRHGMRGHVHGARYGARRLEDDTALLDCFRYVARNPVKALLCASPTQWTWSSYPATVGLADRHSFVDPRKVLACYSGSRELQIAQLREFVEVS
jgi:putative transposase